MPIPKLSAHRRNNRIEVCDDTGARWFLLPGDFPEAWVRTVLDAALDSFVSGRLSGLLDGDARARAERLGPARAADLGRRL